MSSPPIENFLATVLHQ